jgi:hypothetical protein
MQSSQSVFNGSGMIVLNEFDVNPMFGEYLSAVCFHKKAAIIAEHGRFDQDYFRQDSWYKAHNFSNQKKALSGFRD